MKESSDVICVLDRQGSIQHVSANIRDVLGYESNELLGMPFTALIGPEDRAAVEQCQQAHSVAEPISITCDSLDKSGLAVPMVWTMFQSPAGELMAVGHETLALRQTMPLPRQDALNHVLIEHGFDMVGLVDEDGFYTYVGGRVSACLGYRPEQLIGKNRFDFIHPDDLASVKASWQSLRNQGVNTLTTCRYRAADGTWKWIETTISNQTQNPAIRAFAVSSRDITEQQIRTFELAASEGRLRLLFENNPALAVFQSIDGSILDVNPPFLKLVNKQRDKVLNQPLADFLPIELRPAFEQKLREAAAGRRGEFVATVRTSSGEERMLSIRHVPMKVSNHIAGVHVVAKDITQIYSAQSLIKRQAKQLSSILERITDAFFSIDREWNVTYVNQTAERLFNVEREKCLGKNLWSLYPQTDSIHYENFQRALVTGRAVEFLHFSVYIQRWVNYKAYPSEDGLSVFFSDVSDRVEAEQELRRLALVAQGTDNGVVITDAQGRTEWVNEGFTKHTGYTLDEMVGKTPGSVLQGPETEQATVLRIRERMQQRRPFSVNILNYKKSGQKVWLAMEISPVYDEAGQLTQFIAIQQNINYRKEIEASQARMTQDLYRHNRDLQQFTYVISHNLRAPLANALGLARILAKVPKESAAFDTSLMHLGKSIVEVDTVLHDLNTVLSIRDKQDMVEAEAIVLVSVCNEVIENLGKLLKQCGGKVKTDIPQDIVVRGNRAYIYSIFYNLLSNSIKYRSEERALLVQIKCYTGEHDGPTISFADNGSGFDMFKAGSDAFQLYKRFHTNQQGRGIGLFLVKAHVEAMGGKIEVASGLNLGTRFLIHLNQH